MIASTPDRVASPLAAWALVLGLTFALGCPSDTERIAQHLSLAETYAAEGQSREAVIELRSALQLDPTSAEINFRIAEIMQRENNLGDAVFFFQEAHRLAPERSDASLSLARLVLWEDPDLADKLIEEVLDREPDNPLAHVRRSEAALSRNDLENGLTSALTAVEIAPEDAQTHLHLGIVRRAQIREARIGRGAEPDPALYQQALDSFERGIALASEQPDEQPEYLTRGWLERAQLLASWPGREEEANRAFREAVEQAEPWPELQMRALEAVLRDTERTRDVELRQWALERKVNLEPRSDEAWIELARRAERTDGTGSDVLERMVALRPEEARAHALYARQLSQWDRRAEAIEHLEKVAADTRNPAVVWASVVELEAGTENHSSALRALEHLQNEYPDAPQTRLSEARLAFAEGRFEDAAATLRELVEVFESADAYSMLAECELRLSNPGAAVAAVEQAVVLARKPLPPVLRRLKGRAHAAAGDWVAAWRSFRQLAASGQGNMQVDDAVWLVRSLYNTGRQAAGRRVIESVLAVEPPAAEAVLAFAYWEGENEPERARQLLEAVLKNNPSHIPALRQLVRLSNRQRQPELALPHVNAALKRNPDSAALLTLSARAYRAAGDENLAQQSIRRAFELDPGRYDTVWLISGMLPAEEAIALLEKEHAQEKLSPRSRIVLARLHAGSGDTARAIDLLEGVLASNPNLAGAKNDLAYLLTEQGTDLERGLRLAREAREALPEKPQTLHTLGFAMLKNDLAEPAVEQLREAIALVEEGQEVPPIFLYHLGLAYKAAGQHGKATEALERALGGADFPEAEEARRELSLLKAQP
jgi:tetratricopeptide (TPR) repeat protein